jgi:deazaflavin-dependent oxidoreductase (nitroreductase family)
MSVKVPRSGMRGTPFPRFLTAFANRLVLRKFRRGGARTESGLHTLLLETVGARSGATRQAVLGYLEESPESWLVIASMAGASRHPAWLHNLAKQPDTIIEFDDGRRVEVRAETLEAEELEAAWARIAVDAPEYVKYLSRPIATSPLSGSASGRRSSHLNP